MLEILFSEHSFKGEMFRCKDYRLRYNLDLNGGVNIGNRFLGTWCRTGLRSLTA